MALLFGGGVYLYMNMNMMVKMYIERAASQTLDVPVHIHAITIDFANRKAHVNSLTVGNPDGFDEPYSLTVHDVDLTLGAVSKELVVFKDIDVSQSSVSLEVKKNITNLGAIKNRINVPPQQEGQQPMKVIIEKLTMSKAQIVPVSVLFTKDQLEPINVPDIQLTGIGQKENGIVVREAVAQIWAKLADKFNTQALQGGLLEGISPEALGNMGISFGQRFRENLKETIDQKLDAVDKSLNKTFGH